MTDKAIRSAKLTAAGILDKARARTAVTRAGGQIAPSKYLPNVPRQVHAGGGKVDFVKDNPGGDWLESKQARAAQHPNMKFMTGSITGVIGGRSNMFLPTHILKGIAGLNDEVRTEGVHKYDSLLAGAQKGGFDPDQEGNKVVVGVNHYGQPYLLEGNTRVAVAHAMGVPKVKAEVRYWNGAEEADGPMHPDKVSAMASNDPDMTKAEGGRIHAEGGGKMELRSRAAEAIRNQPQLKGSVDQLLAVTAKGKGVKQAELANAGRPSGNIISKEKLAQHFEDAAPDVRVKRYQNIPAVGHTQEERREYNHLSYERVNNRLDEDQISRWHQLHEKTKPKGGTKYGKWTLDIGNNYREHLLHLPSAGGEVNHRVLGAYPRDFDTEAEAHEFIDRMNRSAEQPGMEPIRDSLRQYPLTYSPETPPSDKDFQSSHWDVPNVLAHVRMKDLFGGDGLFVQEVQSDWGQNGREQGFYDPQNPHEVVRKDTKEVVSRHPNYSSMWDAYRTHPDADNLNYGDVRDEKVPQAPYVGNTQQWTDLALKHVLTEAAKNGKYKRVVFAPGEANADLYGQRRQIAQATLKPMPDEPEMLGELYGWDKDTGEQINHGPINDEKELASALGKQHAQALLAQPLVRNSHRSLITPGMVLGGHGMADYYNNIVHPSALKLLQQHDPSIQPEKPYDLPGQEGTDNYYKGLSLPMTETARQSILKNGFGAFKRGGMVGKEEGGALGEDDGITAYHGSPHSFDSFDISKIGTGMGEQAYGKGLYFGGNEHEAKQWKGKSSMDRGSYKLVDKKTQEEISPDALGYEHMREPYKTYGSRLRASDLDYFKYFWTRSADELEQKHIPEYENHGGLEDEVTKMRDNVRHLRAATNTIDAVEAVPQGHMYKVKLRVKPEELLDWHGKLADQNPVIQHIAKNVDLGETRGDHELKMWKNNNADRAATGQHLYEALKRGVDEDGKITYDAENANKILMGHGLKGIRVHAYGSDSFGSPSHNYVMFHHDPVQVTDKYEYGGTVGKEEGGATGSLREKALWPSAQAIKAGIGSREAHAELVNKIKPVSPYATPVPPASDQQVHDALTKDKQPKAFAPRQLKEGTPVAVRLDIPAYEKRNTWVVSVHHPKSDFTAGEVIGYDSVAHIGNPRFGVHPTGALNIASGKPKATIATVHGNWKKTTPEDAFKLSQTIHNDPQWRQVGMDPERHSYFYDRETQEPIMAADEALHIGPLVYAKNPVYGKKTDFAFSSGGDVSAALALTRRFTKDGTGATMALKPKGK